MLKKSLTWAAENGVVIDFNKCDGEIILAVRDGDMCCATRIVDGTNCMEPSTRNFVQEFLYPSIEALKQSRIRKEASG